MKIWLILTLLNLLRELIVNLKWKMGKLLIHKTVSAIGWRPSPQGILHTRGVASIYFSRIPRHPHTFMIHWTVGGSKISRVGPVAHLLPVQGRRYTSDSRTSEAEGGLACRIYGRDDLRARESCFSEIYRLRTEGNASSLGA